MRSPMEFSIRTTDKRVLKRWLRSTTLPQGQITRAKIILSLDQGWTPTAVAEAQQVSAETVHKWRNRYLEAGIEGLYDQPRTGRPTKITEETVKRVLELTTQYVPEESTHWSVELMAKHAQITTWQVRQIWKAADLKPHRLKTFKISNDPDFADKVIDIVGLYMNPPANSVVLCVDEKTQIQALDRTQPGLPLNEGRIGSRTHDYKHHGTTCLYAAFSVLTGKVIGEMTSRARSKEFLSFMKEIDRSTPKGKDLHVILDNHSAHKTPEVRRWLQKKPRIHFHFTATSSSWLNAVEGWFAQFERRSLYRGVFSSVPELNKEIERYIKVHNREMAKPFKWTKDAKSILAAVERAKSVLPNSSLH